MKSARVATLHPVLRAAANWVFGLFSVAALFACAIPFPSQYERLERPGATYYRSSCHASFGPAAVIYFAYHGINVSLELEYVSLGLHIPDNVTAQLESDAVLIEGYQGRQHVEETYQLRAARHGSTGNGYPKDFDALPDPYTANGILGPLVGLSIGKLKRWYFFIGKRIDGDPGKTSVDLDSGTVKLPEMTINGVRYPPEIVPFRKVTRVVPETINC